MNSINKEEITELVRKTNESDPKEAQVAIRITLVSFLMMILGYICWGYIYFPGPLWINFAFYFFMTLAGSILLGLVIFSYSIGNYLYFHFHKQGQSIHWVYRGIFRTLFQIYNIASYLVIFSSSHQIYRRLLGYGSEPILNLEFYYIFFFFIIPAIISYPLARWQRIRRWLEQFASKDVKQNTTE
ncbi:MAG: hypothetical protein ACFE95_19235 [Candidatus Hodarchaeota archaeon]